MVEGVIAVNHDEHVVHMNEAAGRLVGLPIERLRGRNLRTLAASDGGGFFTPEGAFAETGEAVLIDPVIDTVERDLQLLKDLGLRADGAADDDAD